MIEKLIFEFPTHAVKCQEKKAALQQQWLGPWFLFQLRGSDWEDALLGVRCQRRRWPRASNQIEKETNEHRTLNVQHRTSNNVFCLFYKRLSEAIPPFDILRFAFNFV
jgi:hypothetical protein